MGILCACFCPFVKAGLAQASHLHITLELVVIILVSTPFLSLFLYSTSHFPKRLEMSQLLLRPVSVTGVLTTGVVVYSLVQQLKFIANRQMSESMG